MAVLSYITTVAGRIPLAQMPAGLANYPLAGGGLGVDPAYLVRLPLAQMPDGILNNVVIGQGVGVAPVYAAALRFNVFGVASRTADVAVTSTSFVDIASMTTDIVLPDTRRIVAIWVGRATIVTFGISIALLIDGTAVAYSGASNDQRDITLVGTKDAVAAGTRTIKLQARISAGTGYVACGGAIAGEIAMYLLAMA